MSGTHNGWQELDDLKGADKRPEGRAGRTTQKPAIVVIGPAGENQCHGALIHDAGNGAGQGGFGSVWGSKNLKAISVIGTGSIKVADPKALIQARQALKQKYIASYVEPDFRQWSRIGGLANPIVQAPIPTEDRRPQSCQGCVNGCRSRSNLGYGNESACQETSWYNEYIQKVAKNAKEIGEISLQAADLCQRYGINSFVLQTGLPWLEHLHEEGVLGPGKKIHSDLPWEKLGTLEFAEKLIHALSDQAPTSARTWPTAGCRRPGSGVARRTCTPARCSSRTGDARSTATTPALSWNGATAASWATATRTALLQLHVHDRQRRLRLQPADPLRGGGTGHDPGAQDGALREGQARSLRFQRREHVLGGGGPAGALAAALLPLLEELRPVLRSEVA